MEDPVVLISFNSPFEELEEKLAKPQRVTLYRRITWKRSLKKLYRPKKYFRVQRISEDPVPERFLYSDDEADNLGEHFAHKPTLKSKFVESTRSLNDLGKSVENVFELKSSNSFTLPSFCKDERKRTPRRHRSLLDKFPIINRRTRDPFTSEDKFIIIEFSVKLPDGTTRNYFGKNGELLSNVLEETIEELNLIKPLVLMEDSGGEVGLEADLNLVDGSRLELFDSYFSPDARGDDDPRFRIAEKILETEKEYLRLLRTIPLIYAIPLRKFCSLSQEEHRILFDWLEPISSISNMLITKLETSLAYWHSDDTCIGSFFSKKLWNQYEEYHEVNSKEITKLFKDKLNYDIEFSEFCKHRKGATKYDLCKLVHLPVDRSRDYNRYLKEILSETDCSHPDHPDLRKAFASSSEMVRNLDHNQAMTDIDRVQELFPNDDLNLYESDPLTPKSKQIHRSRSITANRLQRAFSAKNKLTSPDRIGDSEQNGFGRTLHRRSKSVGGNKLNCNRKFLMDGPANLVTGVQCQERHLFLFNDILLIAKPRSSGSYKLKARVRISEIWLAECLDDVTEVIKSQETSFVIGWPINNHVATFSTAQAKNLWFEKMKELLSEEKKKDLTCTTMIHVTFYNYINENDTLKLLTVTPSTTAKDCISRCLKESGLNEEERNDYQMWVKSSSDDSPYPLIGHEFPYAIKMNRIKDLFVGNSDNEELQNNINNNIDTRVSFILRKTISNYLKSGNTDTLKKLKKSKKSVINWPPILSKLNVNRQHSSDNVDGSSPITQSNLFNQDLQSVCDENFTLPFPIMTMLRQLFLKGPFTVGIFRKSANARLCREIRTKLDSGIEVDLENAPITVCASLIKEFFRNLPQCVLMTEHYEDWLEIQNCNSDAEQILQIRRIVSKLPKVNVNLLKHFLCVLFHITQKSNENMMSASNLAICIGPSLLTPSANASYSTNPSEYTAKQIPVLVEFLILNCSAIFGNETLTLFGEAPQRDPCRQDSGTEESDSLHSLQERRDDSSIDSLEREFLGESSPKLHSSNRNKMSLSNLSRDSGLTLSDTQLYTPDEEVDSEAGGSSNGGDSALSPGKQSYALSARSVPHINTTGLENQDYGASGIRETPKRRFNKSCVKHSCNTKNLENSESTYDVPKYTRVYTDVNTKTRLNSCYSAKDLSAKEESNVHDLQIKRRLKRVSQTKQARPISNIETCKESLKDNFYRCASEESLLNPYTDYSQVAGINKRPATHRKGRAPSPPAEDENTHPKPPARSSRSRRRGKMEWKRSQSTPRLEGSTESSHNINKHDEPPSYHEALCRQTIFKRFNTTTQVDEVTEQQRLEQTIASKHARQIYEESLKRYIQDKSSILPTNNTTDSDKNQYYSVVAQKPSSHKNKHIGLHRSTSEGLHLKLQHLPPVHLKNDLPVNRIKRLSSQNKNALEEEVNSVGGLVNVKYQFHDCSLYDDRKNIRCSVAKLRQLFSEKSSSTSSSKKSSRLQLNPPPYRPPPPAGKMMESKDCASFLNKPVVILKDLPGNIDDNFGEESYV